MSARTPDFLSPGRVSDEDLAAYDAAGFRNSVGLGQRPVVLVIDVQHRTVGPRVPVLDAIRETGYGPACGERAWAAIDNITPILAAARAVDVPVMFPCVAPKRPETSGAFELINPGVASIDEHGYEFVAEAAPVSGDVVIPKHGPSAFFGTPLAAQLVQRGANSLILLGCTTSGCVRATAVDAFSLNYRTTVVADGVYDRAAVSHEVSLFELDAKYADVRSAADVIAHLRSLAG
jgi:nicotinamidase-related amidase